MSPKIAIVGAGPAGLTLASLLRASNQAIELTVFEKDTSATERIAKGGTIDLHGDTGLAALRAAGLWEPFLKYARYEGQSLIFADKEATRVYEDIVTQEVDRDSPEARPEIDRERLQEILLQSVPAEWFRWGSHLRSVSTDRMLEFEHGTEGPFDLIVGADGAWSKVRPVLTDVRPSYAGISGFEMHILNPSHDHPEVSAQIGRGSFFAYSDRKALQAQRQGDGNIIVYAWDTNTETYPKDLLDHCSHDGETVKRALLETHFQQWAPSLQAWIRACDPNSLRPWILYELPVGTTWQHLQGITLIGDGAHIMSPFSGEGTNAAMKDSLELSKAIIESIQSGNSTSEHQADLDSAIDRFEQAMFPRMKEVMELTRMMKTYQFRDNAPFGFLKKMEEFKGADGRGPPGRGG